MPTKALENPIIQSTDADVLKATLEKHAAMKADSAPPAGVWDPMSAPKEPVKEEKIVEPPKKEEPKPEVVAEVKTEITHETSDEELNKRVDAEAKQYGLTKAAKVHLANQAFAAREAKRQGNTRAATLEAELATIRTENEQLKAKTPDGDAAQAVQKKLEAAEAKLAEKEVLLAGTNVRETDDFKTEIAIPMAKITDEFKSFAADYGVTAEHMLELATLRGKALDNRIEELTTEFDISSRGVAKLNGLLDRHSEIAAKEKAVMTDAKKSYDNFMQTKREQHDAQLAKAASERAAVLPDIWDKAVVAVVPTLKGVNGDLGEEIKNAQSFIAQADAQWFNKQSVADQVRTVAQARALPIVVKHYEGRITELVTKLAAAEKQTKELGAATPGAAGNGAVTQQRTEDAGKLAWDNLFKN